LSAENSQEPGGSPKKGLRLPKISLGMREKTIITIVVGIVAVGLGVNSSIKYEAGNNVIATTHPPPTYTGSAPLQISAVKEAIDSNNDFILVITPCADAAINQTVTDVTVQAGDKIRSTDHIFVGVFVLPQSSTLTYPTVMLRYLAGDASGASQFTIRSDVTLDKIYDNYLSRKYLR
jgi:hypothetical protein